MPIDYQAVACVLPAASGLAKTTKVRALVDQVNRVAPNDTRVLVIGASSCGTKLVARSIYPHSRRTDHRYRAINGRAIAGLSAAVWVQAVPAAPPVPDPAVQKFLLARGVSQSDPDSNRPIGQQMRRHSSVSPATSAGLHKRYGATGRRNMTRCGVIIGSR